MAARAARSFFQNSSRTFAAYRKISSQQTLKSTVKSLQRSSTALHISPALHNILQNLGKPSSPSFSNHMMRLQDLSINIDINTAILSNSDGDSQDTMLEQLSGEDDDDQFRWRDTLKKVKDEIQNTHNHRNNIFAIVYIGGSQFKVTPNDIIMINKLNAEVGSKIRLEKVLLVGGENFTIVGRPLVNKDVVDVQATIIENMKTEKVIVFKKKRRKGYKRTQGHCQELTVLRINTIKLNPDSL